MWEMVVLSLVGSGILLGELLHNRWRLRVWQDAALSCGLRDVEISSVLVSEMTLRARAGPLEVWIEEYGLKSARLVVVVPGPPGFSEVRIRRELYTPSAREIEVGDEPFDSTFFIVGPMRLVCALLDAEARRLLVSVNAESQLEIVGGALRVETSEKQLPRILALLLDVGQRFAQPVDTPRRLAENALRDPAAGVRLKNLLLLVREFPGDPGTAEALRAACADASPQVRLRAAMELGAEGRGVLLDLAESTEDDGCSAQAIRIVGRDLPFERTRAILVRALRRRRIRTALACVEALGRSGAAAAVEVLAQVMALERGELATTAAVALGLTGNATAEGPLIEALERDQADLRVAAANALARVGSPAAVLPLKDAGERFSRDQALRRATRQAIAEIQSRLRGASPGQLSLAGSEAGQLSLAQAEAGQLSLATDPGGQLSLPAGEAGQISLSAEEGLKPSPRGAA